MNHFFVYLTTIAIFLSYQSTVKAQSQPTLPVNFESTSVAYNFIDFDGGNTTVMSNPHMNGINTSATVAQMIKGPNGQIWGGTILNLENPIDFSISQTPTMKVWSPRVGARVIFKVETSVGALTSFEKEDTLTVANAWEELSFDFSGIDDTKSYDKIVIIFDLGVQGDGSSDFTFYVDDIQLGNTNTNVSKIGFDSPITAYPNPSNGMFSIDLGQDLSTVSATLADVTGRTIFSKVYNNTNMLNFELEETAGIYFLTLVSEDKKTTIKLVKE